MGYLLIGAFYNDLVYESNYRSCYSAVLLEVHDCCVVSVRRIETQIVLKQNGGIPRETRKNADNKENEISNT